MTLRYVRLFALSIYVVLAATACGHASSGSPDLQTDMAGINKLRQADIAATLTQNPDQLTAVWEDDGMLLGQGEAPVVGKEALHAAYAKGGVKALSYTPHLQNIDIDGNTAVEWGTFEASFQDIDQKQPSELHGRFLRVLKKQKNGEWKFARIMWQERPRGSS